jgi:hypothetical protein
MFQKIEILETESVLTVTEWEIKDGIHVLPVFKNNNHAFEDST